MKSKKVKIVFSLFILSLCLSILIAGCQEEDNINNEIKIKDFNYVGCKDEDTLEKSTSTQQINYKVVDGNYLVIKHENAWFNCCFDELTTNVELDSISIIFTEDETNPSCDCICRYDIECKIGPLKYGEYQFVLKRSSAIMFEFSLLLNSSTDSTFVINNL